MVSCPEEIAYAQGFITHEQLIALGESMQKNAYGRYLLKLASEVPVKR
jgi:glucose-1-phosphate thymidylyltransferase